VRHRVLPLLLIASLAFTPACGDDDETTPPTDTATDTTADVTPDTAEPPPDTTVAPDTAEDTAVPPDTTEDVAEDTTEPTDVDEDVAEDTAAPTDVADDATEVADDALDVADDTADPSDVSEDTTPPGPTLAQLVEQALPLANDATVTVDTTLEGLTVTLVKPAFGSEDGGVFLQDGPTGAAVHLPFDGAPSGVEATLQAGDTVSLQIGDLRMVGGLPMVDTYSDLMVTGTGADLSAWPRDLGAVDDIAELPGHLSALVTVDLTLTSGDLASGSGYRAFTYSTDGFPAGDAQLRARFPQTLVTALGLDDGCELTLHRGAVWAFRLGTAGALTTFQPSAYYAQDITGFCGTTEALSATATASDEVVVTFNRPIDPATIDATVFTVDPALAVLDAAVSNADPTRVVLTTATQTFEESYTVTVAETVADVFGVALDVGYDTVSFVGVMDPLPVVAVWCFDGEPPSLEPQFVDDLAGIAAAAFTFSTDLNTPSTAFPAGNSNNRPEACLDLGFSNVAPSRTNWSPSTAFAEVSPDSSYFEVTFTAPAEGLASVAFDGNRSGTGPAMMQAYDPGLGAPIGDAFAVMESFDPHPMHVVGPVAVAAGQNTLRFVGFNRSTSSSTGTLRIDNVVLRYAPSGNGSE